MCEEMETNLMGEAGKWVMLQFFLFNADPEGGNESSVFTEKPLLSDR